MSEQQFQLDEQARLALEVAQHAALANGERHCGTEYLLYGLVATARGELVELTELFALNVLRIDRAIERLVDHRKASGTFESGAPTLSLRARHALGVQRLDRKGPPGVFEVLHGLLLDDESGACTVVRDLGVQPDDVRRMVAYGMRHLSRDEIDKLLSDLDRRKDAHRPWWGPSPDVKLQPLPIPDRPLVVGRSNTAEVEITAVGSDVDGFGFTLRTRSLRPWVLPPIFEPVESLVPGEGARYNDGPDFFMLQVLAADGTVVDNRQAFERFDVSQPDSPRLVVLGRRDEKNVTNDRRRADQTAVTTDWWVWALPESGPIEIRVDWPAEAVSGVISFDGSRLRASP